jgi:hypothetical protein
MTRSVFGRTRLEVVGKIDSLRAQRGQRADGGRAECGGRNQLSPTLTRAGGIEIELGGPCQSRAQTGGPASL